MASRSFIVVALALAFAPLLTSAQIYKCGNTWSQVPCGPNAEVIQKPPPSTEPRAVARSLPKPPDLPERPEATTRMLVLCEKEARATLKDPESAKVKSIRRGGVETWCTTPPTAVRYYWMTINAKNSYGAYVGEKPYRCAVDLDETKVTGVSQIGEGEALPAACSR